MSELNLNLNENEQTFNVMLGGVTHSVTGRAEAVTMAKDLSRENHARVLVERADGKVQMQFSGGSLDSFNCETRGFKGE